MSYYVPFRNYFEPLMEAPCPKTDALIRSGFRQTSGGYIEYAKRCGMDVDYMMALPKQGWHFIRSYLDRTEPEKARIENVVCGELIYWLAEVSNALTEEELDNLAIEVRSLDRRKANSLIKERCFSKIVDIVMDEYNNADCVNVCEIVKNMLISDKEKSLERQAAEIEQKKLQDFSSEKECYIYNGQREWIRQNQLPSLNNKYLLTI